MARVFYKKNNAQVKTRSLTSVCLTSGYAVYRNERTKI